jgi:hypothetical protein
MLRLKGLSCEFHLSDGSMLAGEVRDWIHQTGVLVITLFLNGDPIGEVMIKPEDINRIVYI